MAISHEYKHAYSFFLMTSLQEYVNTCILQNMDISDNKLGLSLFCSPLRLLTNTC